MMFGREVTAPRLTAWFGDPHASYVYSGVRHDPVPWTPTLADLRARVERATEHAFNSVLLNFYRDGEDSVSWHSDDEPELGAQPVIASLSLGATRVFQLKHKRRADLARVDIELSHGSLLLMSGNCQSHWKHQIPKRRGRTRPGPRINLTFRRVGR
jgi:alkylated DNA repair dioxygenase AlkB